MEFPQENVPTGSHMHDKDQQNYIMVKGKRTKRQRPQSPIPFTLAANSSPIRDSDDDYYMTGQINNSTYNSNSSPATSAELYQDSTEEEEDMANCLILLARGHRSREHHPPKQLDEDAKFNSRRYLEAATGNGGGKAGYYVYECKTCGRTFPSFQALGGHRASHKKPKNLAAEERRQLMTMLSSSDDEDSHLPSLSLQLSNRNLCTTNTSNHTNNTKAAKTHECSICGAEFASGQALGGHMRRHRGPLTTTASTALSLTPMASDSEEVHVPRKPVPSVSLDLDLNLPAPNEDHRHRGSNFPVPSNQQQQQPKTQLVLSSSTLVDCHY